jgi:hypothetical protein
MTPTPFAIRSKAARLPRPKLATGTNRHSREKSCACVIGPQYTYPDPSSFSFSDGVVMELEHTVPRIRTTPFEGDQQSAQVRSRGRGRVGAG